MKLFSSNDRNLTHQKLAEVLARPDGLFPNAFCQEDLNATEVYQVHHGIDEMSPLQASKVDEVIAALLVG